MAVPMEEQGIGAPGQGAPAQGQMPPPQGGDPAMMQGQDPAMAQGGGMPQGEQGLSPPGAGGGQQMSDPGKPLFPNGFEVDNVMGEGEPSPQEEQEVKDAAVVAGQIVRNQESQEYLRGLIPSLQQGGIETLSGATDEMAVQFMHTAAEMGGISSLQYYGGITQIVSESVRTVMEGGAQFQEQDVLKLLSLTLGNGLKYAAEQGWVRKEEIEELAMRSHEMQSQMASAPPTEEEGMAPPGGGNPGMAQGDPTMGAPPMSGQGPQPSAPPEDMSNPQGGGIDEEQAPKKKRKRKRGKRGSGSGK